MHGNIMFLMVNICMIKMHDSLASIRNFVKYIRSSPARILKFRACVEKDRIDYKRRLILDVPVSWNIMYMMQDAALKFEKEFIMYE